MIPRFGLPVASFIGAAVLVTALPAMAEVPADQPGRSLTLPEAVGSHWVWVPDRLFRHSVLFDGDTGRALGLLDSGAQLTPKAPQWAKERGEIYTVDTVYSRGHRGDRQDFVVIYDAQTLDAIADVELPPRTADTGTGIALFGMLDGERLVVALNQSPGTSVSVVDVAERKATAEIQAQGCAGVFPAGSDRFGMLCGDGTILTVHVTSSGELDHLSRTTKVFDPVSDPISEKGVRRGSSWLFASFEGFIHEVDFGEDPPVTKPPWRLFSDDEVDAGWRTGGAQHLALHAPTGRLYAVVHRGGPGSHKDPGNEIWVYDTASRTKVARFEPENLLAAFLGPQAGFEATGTTGKVLNFLLPNLGVHSIAVSQDDRPLLFYRHADLGALGVLDALTGEHLRDIEEVGLSGALLVVP